MSTIGPIVALGAHRGALYPLVWWNLLMYNSIAITSSMFQYSWSSWSTSSSPSCRTVNLKLYSFSFSCASSFSFSSLSYTLSSLCVIFIRQTATRAILYWRSRSTWAVYTRSIVTIDLHPKHASKILPIGSPPTKFLHHRGFMFGFINTSSINRQLNAIIDQFETISILWFSYLPLS